jgi:LPXTG-site transpeptidase (sortase) family protein
LLEYEVSEKIIVTPEEVPDLVNQKWAVDMITLMACYPILSDAKRILVKALPVDRTAEPESLFSYTWSVE